MKTDGDAALDRLFRYGSQTTKNAPPRADQKRVEQRRRAEEAQARMRRKFDGRNDEEE